MRRSSNVLLPLAALALLGASGAPGPVQAQDLPDGFIHELMVPHPFVGDPTSFARLPDGRFLLIERTTALVRLSANGAGGVPILTVPDVQSAGFEQGLFGIPVDPEWP